MPMCISQSGARIFLEEDTGKEAANSKACEEYWPNDIVLTDSDDEMKELEALNHSISSTSDSRQSDISCDKERETIDYATKISNEASDICHIDDSRSSMASITDYSFCDSSALSCEETNEVNSTASTSQGDDCVDLPASHDQSPVFRDFPDEHRNRILEIMNVMVPKSVHEAKLQKLEKLAKAFRLKNREYAALEEKHSELVKTMQRMVPQERLAISLQAEESLKSEVKILASTIQNAIRDGTGALDLIAEALGSLHQQEMLSIDPSVSVEPKVDYQEFSNLKEENAMLRSIVANSKEVHRVAVNELAQYSKQVEQLQKSLEDSVLRQEAVKLQEERDNLQQQLDAAVPKAKEHLMLLMKNDVLQGDIQALENEIKALKIHMENMIPKDRLEDVEKEAETLRSALAEIESRERNPKSEDGNCHDISPQCDIERASTGRLPDERVNSELEASIPSMVDDTEEGIISQLGETQFLSDLEANYDPLVGIEARPRKWSLSKGSVNPFLQEYFKLEKENQNLLFQLQGMVSSECLQGAKAENVKLNKEVLVLRGVVATFRARQDAEIASLTSQVDQLQRSLKEMVPKQESFFLLEEIARLQKLLDQTGPKAKEHLLLLMKNDVLQGDVQELQREVERLQEMMQHMVPKDSSNLHQFEGTAARWESKDLNPREENCSSTGSLPAIQRPWYEGEEEQQPTLTDMDLQLADFGAIQTLADLFPNAKQRCISTECQTESSFNHMVESVPKFILDQAQEEICNCAKEITRLQTCLRSCHAAQEAAQLEISRRTIENERLRERLHSFSPSECNDGSCDSDELKRQTRIKEIVSPRAKCDAQVLQWKLHLNSILEVSSERPQPCSIEMMDINKVESCKQTTAAASPPIQEPETGAQTSSEPEPVEIRKSKELTSDESFIHDAEAELARFDQLVQDMARLEETAVTSRVQESNSPHVPEEDSVDDASEEAEDDSSEDERAPRPNVFSSQSFVSVEDCDGAEDVQDEIFL